MSNSASCPSVPRSGGSGEGCERKCGSLPLCRMPVANKGLGWDPLPDIESNDFEGDWYPGWGKHPKFQIVSSIAFVLPQANCNLQLDSVKVDLKVRSK